MLVNDNDARPKIRSPNRGKNWYPGRITVPANLVFRLEIWCARDNGIPPRSTPVGHFCHICSWMMCSHLELFGGSIWGIVG